MTRRMFWGWPAMALAVAACSSSTSMGGNSMGALQGCTDVGNTLCDQLQTCSPVGLQAAYGDVATCKSRVVAACPSAVGASGTGVNATNLAACAQAYKALSCDDIVLGTVPPECNVQGSLASGAACGANPQCAGASNYCKIPSGQMCGTCAPRAASGEVCTTIADCQLGLVCSKATTSAMTGVCAMPGAVGATCDTMMHPCAGLLYCVGGTCSKAMEEGGMCNEAASNCDLLQGLFCDPVAAVCRKVKTATPNQMCGYNTADGSYTLCIGISTCKTVGTAVAGTCEAVAADGAACSSSGPSCGLPSLCIGGTCQPPDPSSCH